MRGQKSGQRKLANLDGLYLTLQMDLLKTSEVKKKKNLGCCRYFGAEHSGYAGNTDMVKKMGLIESLRTELHNFLTHANFRLSQDLIHKALREVGKYGLR